MLPFVLLIALAILTTAGFLGRRGWVWELTSHFRRHYFFLLIGLAALFVWSRQPAAAVFSGMLSGVNLLLLWPLFERNGRKHPTPSATYRAVLLNIRWLNRDYARIWQFIAETDADIVILTEVPPEGETALQSLNDTYPFIAPLVLATGHGVMLFSRIPYAAGGVRRLTDGERPSIVAVLDVGERPLTVIGMHPPAPVRPERIEMRNRQLDQMAAFVAAQPTPLLLMGDLNMTPWSPYFRQFSQKSGLVDGRNGFGVHATWPAYLPFLRIPIDHALASSNVQIHGFRVGPNVGSDHLPIIVDFSLPTDR